MDREGRVEHLRWLLERELHWVASADVKAGGLIAAYMALVAIAASILIESATPSPAAKILFGISGLLMVPAFGFALSVFFPRTKANHDSLIFFGEIAKRSAAEFHERLQALDSQVIELDLSNQIHINAVIADCKHHHARCSIAIGGFSLAAWLVAVVTLASST